MQQELTIKIFPQHINNTDVIEKELRKKGRVSKKSTLHFRILKRSIDSRRKPIYILRVLVSIDQPLPVEDKSIKKRYKKCDPKKRILIIGAGPAGYFAALQCLEYGVTPLVLERGKAVQPRRKDLRQIMQFGIVNPHSNYCFGEGGAGTYSDGKLYTRSGKRGSIEKVLQILVDHGAHEDILIDAHPHIGSNKLPKIIEAIRLSIEEFGGEVHFDNHVTDFILKDSTVTGVIVNDEKEYLGDAVILATGHSARDIYHLLHKKEIKIESKPFAMGLRIEHPQPIIDTAQYGQTPRHENLPAASYQLVTQSAHRGVYSFCMCPGGIIIPAATAPNETVVNGMSLSRRDSPFANSGMVVEISEEDLLPYKKHGVFAGLVFQQEIEKMAYEAGGDETQRAPSQRIVDFVDGKHSQNLPKTSYVPGVNSAPLHSLLPNHLSSRLRDGIFQFGKKMHGYYTNEAQVVGVESRSSSPIRIPRNPETLAHVTHQNLYPCGEGAGYAGGIVSAALDGQRVVDAILKK